ncbi:hypothetical protein MSAN_02305200 [Mycena sanguinolenta]|uniref:Transmembrane protein n=1 Tax=Mycena sanguinolenta TaxID=230812 RepID=A0A8H7CGH9_9AGAR|nr:hypothetical protein MSAN_02305200 [Mycena sanguinolenta]
MASLSKRIKSFRLGYTEERPYPWRWTTPIVLGAFFLICPFLALVNIPLSAYNIVQQLTYSPNDALPAIFLGNIVPSVFQNPTDSFTPQLLNVGETIALDNYIFNYTISQAFDGVDTTNPVPAFPYYNIPFSDSCDVANITVQLLLNRHPEIGWIPDVQVSGTVACYLPIPFYLTWSGLPEPVEFESFRNLPFYLSEDVGDLFFDMMWSGPDLDVTLNVTQVDITFTVHPCCDCDAVLADGLLENGTRLLQTPCSSNPPHFVVVADPTPTILFYVAQNEEPPYHLWGDELGSYPMQIADLLAKGHLGNISISDLNTENLLQTVYHLVRVDLGVILENQIYNSPEMFNRSISPLDLGVYGPSEANVARNLTSNTTLMAQWQRDAEFFQNNTRVPPLEYLRSVPRLKPLGSAVTSVFVSTFAMISVMWTVFSLVAGALARKYSAPNDTLGKKHSPEQSRTWNKVLENGMEEVDGSEVILLGVMGTCAFHVSKPPVLRPKPNEPRRRFRTRENLEEEHVNGGPVTGTATS